jgi:hypothetical protein
MIMRSKYFFNPEFIFYIYYQVESKISLLELYLNKPLAALAKSKPLAQLAVALLHLHVQYSVPTS